MEDLIKKQIADQITKSQIIKILVSNNSGFDGLASGLALFLSLKKIGKNPTIVANAPSVGDAQTLYSVDKINISANKKDLIIIIPDAIKNVDKVSYSITNDKLKIKIHSLGESIGITQEGITFDNASTSADLIFLLGYGSDDELRDDSTYEDIKSSDSYKISLSTSVSSLNSAQINVNNPNTSGLSELICDLIINLSLPIDEDTAFNLYTGIKNSTHMFSPVNVRDKTLELAQKLIKHGAGNASMANKKDSENTILSNKENTKNISETNTQQDDLEALSKKISANYNSKNKYTQGNKLNIKSRSMSAPIYEKSSDTPIKKVEGKESGKRSWLKPPKIYRGSKSFDRES